MSILTQAGRFLNTIRSSATVATNGAAASVLKSPLDRSSSLSDVGLQTPLQRDGASKNEEFMVDIGELSRARTRQAEADNKGAVGCTGVPQRLFGAATVALAALALSHHCPAPSNALSMCGTSPGVGIGGLRPSNYLKFGGQAEEFENIPTVNLGPVGDGNYTNATISPLHAASPTDAFSHLFPAVSEEAKKVYEAGIAQDECQTWSDWIGKGAQSAYNQLPSRNSIVPATQNRFSGAMNVATDYASAAQKVAENARDEVNGWVSTVRKGLNDGRKVATGYASTAYEQAIDMTARAQEKVKAVSEEVSTAFQQNVASVRNTLSGGYNTAQQIATGMISDAGTNVSDWWALAKAVSESENWRDHVPARAGRRYISQQASKLGEKIQTGWEEFLSRVGTGLADVIAALGSCVESVAQGAQSGFRSVLETMRGVTDRKFNPLAGLASISVTEGLAGMGVKGLATTSGFFPKLGVLRSSLSFPKVDLSDVHSVPNSLYSQLLSHPGNGTVATKGNQGPSALRRRAPTQQTVMSTAPKPSTS
ncbi:hypothetical protein M231_04522 [Tremella mesenterica]|uniref:Uncharacterized protein n=1 Tax=Tremella mesenterica TaxID=5217 RepID=A0A4Q1BKC2_TREME|nr:hypothetical protein M231_04522 [Tremella mesenterica]